MTRFLLLVSTIMLSIYNSDTRPQTFFSDNAHNFSPADIFANIDAAKKQSNSQPARTARRQSSNQPTNRRQSSNQSANRRQSFNQPTASRQSSSKSSGRRPSANQSTSRKQGNSILTSFRSALSSDTGNFIEQTRTQADELMSSLRSLAREPEAAPILERVFSGKNSDCIDNMDQAIQAIETSTQLMENAGTELELLVKMVGEFRTINDTPTAVRKSAAIIRLLDVLIPKLTPPSSPCKTNDKDVIDSMFTLESIVNELSSKDDLYYTPQVKQSLADASQILTKVTTFLTKESHFKFDQFCTDDKDYVKEFFTGIGNMMVDLENLYVALGPELDVPKTFRKQEAFTKKVIANIEKLADLDVIPLDCNSVENTKMVANTLEDLAGVIEDIGIENLCSQLDLDVSDCRF